MLLNPITLTTGMASASTSLWRGTVIRHKELGERPEKLLKLYDMEGCPYCKLVREVLTELDLNAKILPCPKGGDIYRKEVRELGGKEQFPFLVDPNTGTQLYESSDIIDYLFKQYGSGSTPFSWKATPITTTTSKLSGLFRPLMGTQKRYSKQPEKPLELYSFESSPYSKPVRERLTELELPYILNNLGKFDKSDFIIPQVRKHIIESKLPNGPLRKSIFEKYGKLQVPLLVDPNTNVDLFESDKIVNYLMNTYAI